MIRTLIVAAVAGLGLAACTPAQVGTVVQEGQLFCAVGPTVVGLASPSGAAILAKGSTKAFVDAACAVVGGMAVSPPGAPVSSVTIPAVVVPLKAA